MVSELQDFQFLDQLIPRSIAGEMVPIIFTETNDKAKFSITFQF